MKQETLQALHNLWLHERELQTQAYMHMLEVTAMPVAWAYEIWDELLLHLTNSDNHNRSIAAQLLCNLARSDPEQRMLRDFPAIVAVTKDKRFVTARHSLQSLWKVALAGTAQQQLVMQELEQRFETCQAEKNYTLIRYDIIQNMYNLYAVLKDEAIRQKALTLIASESDLKYRKKYATLWKNTSYTTSIP